MKPRSPAESEGRWQNWRFGRHGMHSVNIYKWGTIEKTDLPNIVRLQGHTRHYLCLWLSHIVSNYVSSYESWRMKRHV